MILPFLKKELAASHFNRNKGVIPFYNHFLYFGPLSRAILWYVGLHTTKLLYSTIG